MNRKKPEDPNKHVKLYSETRHEANANELRRTYSANNSEIAISFPEGVVEKDEKYYIVQHGANFKLIQEPTTIPDIQKDPVLGYAKRIRFIEGRELFIALPSKQSTEGELFRIFPMKEPGKHKEIWLARLKEFNVYVDENTLPLHILHAL